MIKRTPQEIADIFEGYLAMNRNGAWYLFASKPDRYEDTWRIGSKEFTFVPEGLIDIPANHDWTILYEPQGKEGKTEEDFPYFTETADSDNKQDAYSEKQVDSDNKEAPHQSQVHVHAEYCIVTNVNPVGLSGHVRELVSEGWRPQGGVAVEHLPKSEGYVQDCCYHQAMVRELE